MQTKQLFRLSREQNIDSFKSTRKSIHQTRVGTRTGIDEIRYRIRYCTADSVVTVKAASPTPSGLQGNLPRQLESKTGNPGTF